MTPLAHRVARELTLPIKDRTFIDKTNALGDRTPFLGRLDDIHCFEVTEVLPLMMQFGKKVQKSTKLGENGFFKHSIGRTTCFLPGRRTWIENRSPRGRFAYFIEDQGRGWASVDTVGDQDGYFGAALFMTLAHGIDNPRSGEFQVAGKVPLTEEEVTDENCEPLFQAVALGTYLYAALACINTPRIFGRRTHSPHKGLHRALNKTREGSYPLHAWHEIRLQVFPPSEPRSSGQGGLTGEKALHWVRAFCRVRLGRWEEVRDHHRGNPALGIKQARYLVTP